MNPVYISCAVISAAPTPKKVVKSNNGRPTKKAKAKDLAVVQVIVLDEVKCAAYVDGKKQKISFFKVHIPNSLSALVQVYEDVQLHGDVGYLPSKWVAFMRRLNPSLHYCIDKQEESGKLTMVLNVLVCVNSVLSWDVSRGLWLLHQTHSRRIPMALPSHNMVQKCHHILLHLVSKLFEILLHFLTQTKLLMVV